MSTIVSLMNEELRTATTIRLRRSILKKARVRGVNTEKTLGKWIEEAIEEKAAREEREKA